LKEKVAELTESLKDSDRLNQQLQSDNKKLVKKIRKAGLERSPVDLDELVKERVSTLQRKHDREISNFQKTIAELNSKIGVLENSVKKMRESHANQIQPSLGEEVKAARLVYEVEVDRLNGEINSRNQQINQYLEKIDELQKEISKLESTIQIMSREDKENQNRITNQQNNIDRLREELRQESLKFAEAISTGKDNETKLIDQETTIHELELKIGTLKRGKVQTVAVGEYELEQLRAEIDAKDRVIAVSKNYLKNNRMI
jgi:chromosome segregation ATPase